MKQKLCQKGQKLHSLLPRLPMLPAESPVPVTTETPAAAAAAAASDAGQQVDDPLNLVLTKSARQAGRQQVSKPTYLTRPLNLCKLVASELISTTNQQLIDDEARSNNKSLEPEGGKETAASGRRRKSPAPRRQLETLDFHGEPLPALGRQSAAQTDQEEARMRWHHLCPVCHRRLGSSSLLYSHVESHCVSLWRASKQVLGQRIRCCLCLELLPTWKRFRTHMQRHTGHQPFRCRHCAQTFSTNGNLKRHLSRKHR